MSRTLSVPAVVAALTLAACGGGGGGGGGGSETCSPSGTSLQITSQNVQFDKSCLAAPAGQSFTITLDNKDTTEHNVAIYTDSSANQNLFRGELITGPKTTTYHVQGLDAGMYFFRCDVHPSMNGTFVVE
jgi:plastocyanin